MIAYAIHGDVNVGYAALVGLPAAVSVAGATALQQRLQTRTIELSFAAFMLAVAVWLFVKVTYALAIALGLVAGVLAGMFGIGGGLLFVPTLIALGLGHHEALGTSLLAIIPTVLVGTWRQARYGNVRWRAAAVLWDRSRGGHAQGGVALAVCAARRDSPPPFRRIARPGCGADRMASASARVLTYPVRHGRTRGSLAAARRRARRRHRRADPGGGPGDRPTSSVHRTASSPSGRSPTSASASCWASSSSTRSSAPRTPTTPGSRPCCDDPKHHDALRREVKAVAEEIAADPRYADEEPLGPDEARVTVSGNLPANSSPATDLFRLSSL